MLGRIFGSISFRLALAYTAVFGASVAGLFYFVFLATAGFADQQMEAAIRAEVTSFIETYQRAGASGLVMAVNRRTDPAVNRDGIYLLVDSLDNPLAGNLRNWPSNVAVDDMWINFSIQDMESASAETADVRALQFMDTRTGLRLLVGRDVRDARLFRRRLLESFNVGIGFTVALGLLGGFVFSRTVMRRIESITRTCRHIMSGDLSQRVQGSRRNDELGQLSRSINEMLDQIERLMKGMQQVSESVAHDLRTPLNRLRSRLEALQRQGIDDPAQRDAIDAALGDADSLLATFAALLRVARAEASPHSNFTDLDLPAIAEDVADLYQPLAEEKGLAFVADFQDRVAARGDRNLVAQALANLVDNAIKYTPSGGAVTFSLASRDGGALFTVADTGPGVPDEYKDKVLERLFRLEESRTSPGSGLGLSLVAAVARSHNLTLKLEDNMPGLRVTLQFPPVEKPRQVEARTVKALPPPPPADGSAGRS